MKRIRVPGEMLKAAKSAHVGSVKSPYRQIGDKEFGDIVEAVLRYISEHPQVPTDEWVEKEIVKRPLVLNSVEIVAQIAVEWQRRCFVQEEPEIPAEIEDLLDDGSGISEENFDKRIIEAYRRGLRKR